MSEDLQENLTPAPASSAPSLPKTRLVLHEKPGGFFRKLLTLLCLGCALGVVVGVGVVVWAYQTYSPGLPELPSVDDYRPPILSELWSADAALCGEFYDERRRVVPYERIPKKLIQAFVAAEDQRFFDHPGFDLKGTLRAAYKTYVVRERIQGGSTLSQQAAKAVLVSVELSKITDMDVRAEVVRMLGEERMADQDAVRAAALKAHAKLRAAAHARATEKTVRRKIRELILALRLERALTKEQILYLYLNNIYLGHHAYGVQAAAENYFRKDVEELTLAESALLAVLPKAPSATSPFRYPKKARERRTYVLGRMLAEGMISQAERDAANAEEIRVFPVEDVFRLKSPFFSEQIRRDVVNRYGNERLLKDGLKITMTMNAERQFSAQQAMLEGLIRVDKRQGFPGPLAHLATPKEREGFSKDIARRLGDEKLTPGHYYVGFVERIDAARQIATIDVGGQKALLPLLAMRWAREPNPEKRHPNALIDAISKALKEGDAIIVRARSRDDFTKEFVSSELEKKTFRKLPLDAVLVSLEQAPTLQGALMSVDPKTSYVEAMIGGYDFDASEFNRAFQACRQPGSAFKPLVYSAALELLEWQVNQVLVDAPVVFDDPSTSLRWKPENFGSEFQGDVLLVQALKMSMNIPAVKTLHAVGLESAVEWVRRLGITTKLNEDLSMALGGSCVQLHELTSVYATMNRGGLKFTPKFLRKVEDRFGRTLEDHTDVADDFARFEDRVAAGFAQMFDEPERVMSRETAFLIDWLMREVVRSGTGGPAGALRKPAAGKTGTTNDSFDTWFMGFTEDLVTGVWMGYDRYDHPLGRYETGGRASLPIWVDYMKRALNTRPQAEFDLPKPGVRIVMKNIDPATGKLAAPGAPREKSIRLPFVEGKEPVEEALGEGLADPREMMWMAP
ncbi:MAG: transglycosylase domain-containing protein [Myxococcales bacterium]|jgi:penicillin-binding protein 1A|nr:transglycosylase domain-containing protein [Myxococcales bacterium]